MYSRSILLSNLFSPFSRNLILPPIPNLSYMQLRFLLEITRCLKSFTSPFCHDTESLQNSELFLFFPVPFALVKYFSKLFLFHPFQPLQFCDLFSTLGSSGLLEEKGRRELLLSVEYLSCELNHQVLFLYILWAMYSLKYRYVGVKEKKISS